MTSTALKEQAFQKLSRDLEKILTKAHGAANEEKLAGYWDVGARIAKERLAHEAGYHNAVLRELALTIQISVRTLQQAVRFHQAYDAPPKEALSWAHYRVLASLQTNRERAFYTAHALKEAWSVRKLEAAIRADLFSGEKADAPTLPRPTDSAYVYQAENPRLIDADTLDVDIDLGFQVWTRKRLRLARIDAPEAGSKEGRAAKNYLHGELSRAQTLVVRTEKVDLHGRYVADLFLSPERTTPSLCYQTGTHVNALLVSSGHAVVVG